MDIICNEKCMVFMWHWISNHINENRLWSIFKRDREISLKY